MNLILPLTSNANLLNILLPIYIQGNEAISLLFVIVVDLGVIKLTLKYNLFDSS